MDPKVDAYLLRQTRWQAEMTLLRSIALGCPLVETLKWGHPCYTLDGKNVALIHGFNAYCGMLFPKGALLDDPHRLLIQQTENVQAARQLRFTGIAEVEARADAVRGLLLAAIGVERAGLKVALKPTAAFAVAPELQAAFDASPALRTAFEALTPGRQRAYHLHFGGAKRPQTRAERVAKHAPRILVGLGLDD